MVLGLQSTFLGKCWSEDHEQYSHNEEVLCYHMIVIHLIYLWDDGSPPTYCDTFHRSWYPWFLKKLDEWLYCDMRQTNYHL